LAVSRSSRLGAKRRKENHLGNVSTDSAVALPADDTSEPPPGAMDSEPVENYGLDESSLEQLNAEGNVDLTILSQTAESE
uniref:Uncharacterized protein n=1 Tax=Amphimedon queenslandica TaxID=400682 RepID=A0A1X7VI99_AMPQE